MNAAPIYCRGCGKTLMAYRLDRGYDAMTGQPEAQTPTLRCPDYAFGGVHDRWFKMRWGLFGRLNWRNGSDEV